MNNRLRWGAVLALLALISLGSCATVPAGPFDPRGAWTYALTDQNNNTWDSGTFELTGTSASGILDGRNYYAEAERGTWTWDGREWKASGSWSLVGTLTGDGKLKGTWKADSGDQGTFVATR